MGSDDRRLETRDTAQRGNGATKPFGVRREAKRRAALAAWAALRKAVSPLRSATALQNRRGLRQFQAILIDWKSALQAGAAGEVHPEVQAIQQPASAAADEKSFLSLFLQEALPHWRQCGPGRFIVTNGVATGVGGMGLWWYAARPFTNFVLRGEFVQEQEGADSGVFVRFPDPAQDPWNAVHQGHEVEIGDPEPKDPTWRTGSVYPFQASTKANTKPPGQWNQYEIVCVGHHYAVRINGEQVTQWTDPKQRSARGYIGLQNYSDGKTVRHRLMRIKELP